MNRYGCSEFPEDECQLTNLPDVPVGFVASGERLIYNNGHRYYQRATGTSLLSQEDAEMRAFMFASEKALELAGLIAVIDFDGAQILIDDSTCLAY